MKFVVTALLCLCSTAAAAQGPVDGLWPNTVYDPAIPTLDRFVGHRPGDAITTPDQIGRRALRTSAVTPAADFAENTDN